MKSFGDIEQCEISPSSKAKCDICRRIIPKGTPRLFFRRNWSKKIEVKGEGIIGTFNIKRFICYKCSNEILKRDISIEKAELNRLRLIKKKFNSYIKNDKIQGIIKNSEIMEELQK